MVKTIFFKQRKDGVNLYINYSDENKRIKKVGTNEVYSSAIDIENAPYSYIEINENLTDFEIENLKEILSGEKNG